MKSILRFSLIEMLVVISLFLVLLSLIQPSLSRISNQSKEVVCINNVKKILTANEFLLEEGIEKFGSGTYIPHTISTTTPPARSTWRNRKHWPGILSIYLGSNYKIGLTSTFNVPQNYFCPHDEVIPTDGQRIMNKISYGYNSSISWYYSVRQELTIKNDLPDPSRYVLFADSNRDEDRDYITTGAGSWSPPGFVHDQRTTSGYADLHVEPRYEFEIQGLGQRN